MSTCAYTDYMSSSGGTLGSPDSLVDDDSFSDSETSSSSMAADALHPGGGGPVSLDYLAEFLTDHPMTSAHHLRVAGGGAVGLTGSGEVRKSARSKSGRKPCKYVPHAEKPGHVVEKRNARERRRVEAVNSAFVRLRKVVPHENRRKRISKVKTLRVAMDYINYLQDLIDDYDRTQRLHHHHHHAMAADVMGHHQHQHHQQHQHHHHQHQNLQGFSALPHGAYINNNIAQDPHPHSPGWGPPAQPHLQHEQHHAGGHPVPGGPGVEADGGAGEGGARYGAVPTTGPCLPQHGLPPSLYYPQDSLVGGYGLGTTVPGAGRQAGGAWSAPKLYTYDQS